MAQIEQIKTFINTFSNKVDLNKNIRNYIIDNFPHQFPKNMCVYIIAAPCHGFGDIIFAAKFARYIRWGFYGKKPLSTNVKIITPAPEMFLKLGITDIDIISLPSNKNQCRRMKHYNRPKNLPRGDLFFVAPLQYDFYTDYNDIRHLFSESTPFNTIMLSEYQDDKPLIDLLTGIGKQYYGLLFDGIKPGPLPTNLLKKPFALGYLSQNVGNKNCISSFVKLIVTKYSTYYKYFYIIVPQWAIDKILANKSLCAYIKKYFDHLIVENQNVPKEGSVLTLIAHQTVSRNVMASIMKHSVSDILVTGDQSITDVIDCCADKIIWYQQVPWKVDFAKALATALPQKYLKTSITSCGTLKGINLTLNSSKFKKNNDFRSKAAFDITGYFTAVTMSKKGWLQEFLKELNTPGPINYKKLSLTLQDSKKSMMGSKKYALKASMGSGFKISPTGKFVVNNKQPEILYSMETLLHPLLVQGKTVKLNDREYFEYRFKCPLKINDCLLFAEALCLNKTVYNSKKSVFKEKNTGKVFGFSYQQNMMIARDPNAVQNYFAEPNVNEAFAIVNLNENEMEEEPPYHIALVLFKDGLTTITLEADTGTQDLCYPIFDMYKIPFDTFHERYKAVYPNSATIVLQKR